MSNTAVLERAPIQMNTSLKDRLISPAEEEHKSRISDNFRRLRFDSVEAYNSARDGDPVADIAVAEPAKKQVSPAAARIAQYTPIAAPAGRHELFEGVVFKDGKLEMPQTEVSTSEAAVVTSAPAPAADEEDATPTRRTMDMLNRFAASQTQEALAETATHAVLSTRMKAALIAVAATVLLAIIVICICSSVIRSINAGIADRQLRLEELMRETQQVQEQIADLTSPESIAEWAAEHNMVRE